MTDLDSILREIEQDEPYAKPEIARQDTRYRWWLRDRANLKRAVLALKAAERLIPFMHDDLMEGETEYEQAVLAFEAALASFKAQR